jgi:hypothetical protein
MHDELEFGDGVYKFDHECVQPYTIFCGKGGWRWHLVITRLTMHASNVNIIANNNFNSHKNDNNDLAIFKTNIVFLHVFSLNVSPLAIRLYIRIVLDR